MKILPKKEFRELAIKQRFGRPESVSGFIDKETHEVVFPEGSRTRVRTHEVGHERLEHFPKAVKFYGKGRKDVNKIYQPWRQMVDDEIEAEIESYKMMEKRVTPRIGVMAIRELLAAGWEPYQALSLVIGRLRHYGIKTSYEDRGDLAGIIERGRREEVGEFTGLFGREREGESE